MVPLTPAERTQLVAARTEELRRDTSTRHETVRIPWRGGEPAILDVIQMDVDDVLLNPDSHRIRSQLQSDPEWAALSDEPYCEDAQRVIEHHVREASKPEQFSALKESLLREGQTEPGLMTHDGVLINANTRAVALRELADPDRRYIRVGVLPDTANGPELALVELRLQMQEDLKVEYSMTNELLFIEELSSGRHLSTAQIARELRINPESERKGAAEVDLRLRLLDLIRVLQRIPESSPPLTFFNSIALQHLKDLYSSYTALMADSPDRAPRLLEAFMLTVSLGITAVHQVRVVDDTFMDDYMLPAFEEDEFLGEAARAIAIPPAGVRSRERPAGVDALLGRAVGDEQLEDRVDVRRLIDLVGSRHRKVKIPDTSLTVPRDELREALEEAIRGGIAEKKRNKKEEDVLGAPTAAVKRATQQVKRARAALEEAVAQPDFDERRKKTLEAAFKKLTRAERELRAALAEHDVIEQ